MSFSIALTIPSLCLPALSSPPPLPASCIALPVFSSCLPVLFSLSTLTVFLTLSPYPIFLSSCIILILFPSFLLHYCPSLLFFPPFASLNRLVGLVDKASASRAEDPGFESRLRRDYSGASHISDLKIGTPVATLPGAWCYRVSAGTGWPCVSIL